MGHLDAVLISGWPASLADRHSVRQLLRRMLDPQQLQQAVELLHQRLHLRHIARLFAVLFSCGHNSELFGIKSLTKNRSPNRRSVLRAQDARPHDPYRREKVTQISQGGATHHGQPTAGPLDWRAATGSITSLMASHCTPTSRCCTICSKTRQISL